MSARKAPKAVAQKKIKIKKCPHDTQPITAVIRHKYVRIIEAKLQWYVDDPHGCAQVAEESVWMRALADAAEQMGIGARFVTNGAAPLCDSADIIDEIPLLGFFYNAIFYRVSFALETSDGLLAAISADSAICARVGMLSSAELDPAVGEKERAEIERRRSTAHKRKTSTRYTCKKCGKRETYSMEYQSRAGDEAATYTVTCLYESCRNSWRV